MSPRRQLATVPAATVTLWTCWLRSYASPFIHQFIE